MTRPKPETRSPTFDAFLVEIPIIASVPQWHAKCLS
jgi:hypothetical protein